MLWLSQAVADIGPEGLDALYIRAGDQLLGLIRDGPDGGPTADRYYHLDGLGSVRTLSDTTGATVGSLDYTAFGERLAGADNTQVYGFAGEPLSLAGLAYHRARWMDPSVGRFLSRDPFAGWPGSPASLHGYGYADSLDNEGVAEWDAKLRNAIEAGFTATEILMALRWHARQLSEASLRLSRPTRKTLRSFLEGLEDVLR